MLLLKIPTQVAIIAAKILGFSVKSNEPELSKKIAGNIIAIIFPAIFLDSSGSFDLTENPKILAAIIATCVGIFSRSILATIFSGLASYWAIIFI